MSYSELQNLLRTLLAEANKPNALEQKQLEEEAERSRRRHIRALEEGYEDSKKRWNQQHNCTHRFYGMGEAEGGNMAPKDRGQWKTGGQVHASGDITLLCLRCNTTWRWKGSPQEIEYVNNSAHGLLGFAPPPIERCLNKDEFVMEYPQEPALLRERREALTQ
jgi:hypothetical protein